MPHRPFRRLIVTVFAVLVGAAICLAPTPAVASATSSTDTLHLPFDNVALITNPCNGETIVFSGFTNLLFHHNTNGTDGFNDLQRADIHAEGSGDLTGTTYRFHNSNLHRNTGNPNEFTSITEGDLMVVAEGSAPNFVAHFVSFINLTPSGNQNLFFLTQGPGCTSSP